MRIIAIIFLCCIPSLVSAAVFINEIAWMGTSDSASNEWIELANTDATSVDLVGWVLSIEGKKDIVLSGSINGNGFYLIERTDDTTVPTVIADLVTSFGTGLANAGAALSLKDTSGITVDRVDGTATWNIGGVVAGDNTTKETAQKGTNGWSTGTPTPRAVNVGVDVSSQEQTVSVTQTSVAPAGNSSFHVEPQIIADAGSSPRVVSTGAPITFTGRVFGLKKEPIENARMGWSFGDGGYSEGVSAVHTYYYPGDYIAVLDAASGYYSASDRVTVHVATPLLALRIGGDSARSFVAIENRGGDEIDLSLWQIESASKVFIIPQNTILGARKTLTLASEVTGLATPAESVATLHFPNGTRVEMQSDMPSPVSIQAPVKVSETKKQVPAIVLSRNTTQGVSVQKATVADAFVDDRVDVLPQQSEKGSMWPWYIGIAFLGALALLGLRMTRDKGAKQSDELNADDFEIVEDEDKKEDIF